MRSRAALSLLGKKDRQLSTATFVFRIKTNSTEGYLQAKFYSGCGRTPIVQGVLTKQPRS